MNKRLESVDFPCITWVMTTLLVNYQAAPFKKTHPVVVAERSRRRNEEKMMTLSGHPRLK